MMKKSRVLGVAIALAVLLGTVNFFSVGAVSDPGQTAKLFVGAVGTSTPVFRYDVGMTGAPTLDLTLTHSKFALPGFFAFSPAGEMFVVNNGGGVSRFLDPQGTRVFNGFVTSSEIVSTLLWGSFRGDELFLANTGGRNVVRFIFDGAGNAVFNGTITAGLSTAVRAVQANPTTGELFVTMCCFADTVRRFLIDASGNAVPNGSITGGGLNNPHDLAFSPWGELFVVNGVGNSISRFVFDALGNASANGLIAENSLNIPLGVDFSPWGELFVANRNDGLIHRWVFDGSFNATFNGSFQHVAGIHDLQFAPSAVQVEIDIKPGSDPNSMNVRSRGVVPVAILSTADFDASSVDPATVRFGPDDAGITHRAGHIDDVNGDGFPDLLLHFQTTETGIACGETSASLTGQIFVGQAIQGEDTVRPVPCR